MNNRQYSPAKIRSASFDEDANTIDIVWSTGADVLREDYDGEYIERLLMGTDNVRLDRLNAGAPFLNTHSSSDLGDVIGSVVEGSAKIENGRGVATIKLSTAAADVDVVQKIREGVIRNISVGYWVHHSVRQEGEPNSPDVHVIDDWEPLEISAVPIPADAGAQIRSAGGKRPRDRRTPAERAAAYTRRLLGQPTQTRAEARGAAEARRMLGSIGRMANVPRVGKMNNRDVEAGALEARKLLGRP